jgi:two-component system response regulator HydG
MFSRTTVLCVDGYLPGLFVRKLVLESHGYEVRTAGSAKCALQLARKRPIDVVLLDYKLPDQRGEDLACALRTLLPNAYIVLFSNEESWTMAPAIFRYVDGYIHKGANPGKWLSELSSIVQEHLGNFRQADH